MDQTYDDQRAGRPEVRMLRLDLTLSGFGDIPETADSVCHIAGFAIRVGEVIRQRCAWCGEMLSVAEAGVSDRAGVDFPSVKSEETWQVGALVRRRTGDAGPVGIIWQDETPADACFN